MKYDVAIDMTVDSAPTLILRRIRPCARVLEFGPSTGYMTQYMRDTLHCQVWAVEVDAEAARRAEPFCERMIVADLDQDAWIEALGGELFEHLIFADVLEHVKDPWKVLQEAARHLKPGGTVLTSIPNVGFAGLVMDLIQGRFEYRETGLLDRTHLRFFTRNSVAELLDGAGLQPVEWLATRSSPEKSEFGQEVDRFPGPLGEALRRKEDAETYQFVTVSTRKGEGGGARGEEPAPSDGYIDTLFAYGWFADEAGQYPFPKPLTVALRRDPEWHAYDMPFAADSMCNFTLVPLDRPGYVEVRNLRLKTGTAEEALAGGTVIQDAFLLPPVDGALCIACESQAQIAWGFPSPRRDVKGIAFEARAWPGCAAALSRVGQALTECLQAPPPQSGLLGFLRRRRP